MPKADHATALPLPRRAGSDAERRATVLLAGRLGSPPRTADTVPFWWRGGDSAVTVLLVAIGIAAALLAAEHATACAVVIALALVLLTAPDLHRRPLRWLVPARASQVVTSTAPRAAGRDGVDLLIVARTDVPVTAAADRLLARARCTPERVAAAGLLIALAAAVARAGGATATGVRGGQFAAVLVLLVALGALADRLAARPGPREEAGADAALAAALALAGELDRAPARRLAPTVVLSGAGAHGLERVLRALRAQGAARTDLAVLELTAAPGPAGAWWERSGAVLPRRLHPAMVRSARAAATGLPAPGARARPEPARGPAAAARAQRVAAIAVGVAPDGAAAATRHALALVRALDAELAAGPAAGRTGGRGRDRVHLGATAADRSTT